MEKSLIPDPNPLCDAWPKVFDEHIRLGYESVRDPKSLGGLEIEHNSTLVQIAGYVRRRKPVLRRHHHPDEIALRRLQFDYVGAECAKKHTRPWTNSSHAGV